jgi:4-amino-4-deoxy-L-arabinose transferase-like glycosyltransferase
VSTPLPPRGRRRLTRLALLAPALGAAAFALALAVTDPPGPGLDPDAMAYLGAAASLARAGRYDVPAAKWASADSVSPLTHFPPGFPTTIAIPVRLGMAPAQGARLVVALAAFATVTIAAWTVGAAVGAWAGTLAAILRVATPALVDAHLSVLSEPLFLACVTAATALMARPAAPEWTPTGGRRALALGAVGAAAALVRYAGISVPAAAALWLLLERTTARRSARLRNAALAAAPALVLLGAWGARNALLGGVGAREPRAPLPYLAGFGQDLGLGARTLRDWLAPLVEPERVQWLAAGAALLLVVLLVAAALRRAEIAGTDDGTRRAVSVPPVTRVFAAAGLLLAAYVGELIASRLFVYGTIPFDERILAPVILLVELAVAAALGGWWPRRRRPLGGAGRVAALGLRIAAAVAVAAWLAGSVALTSRNVAYVVANGSDFAGAQWRESPLLAYVRARARDRVLYSNWPAAIWFHTGRAARDLPSTLDSVTLAAFAGRLAATGGVVVAFDAPSPDVAPPDSIARRLRLRRVRRFSDGTLWRPSEDGAARR